MLYKNQRFVSSVLLFSILLQSCGNPNLRMIAPVASKTEAPTRIAKQHTLLQSRDMAKEASEETTALAEPSSIVPSSEVTSTSSIQATTATSGQVMKRTLAAHSSTLPANAVKTLVAATCTTRSSLHNITVSPILPHCAALPTTATTLSRTSSTTEAHNDRSKSALLQPVASDKTAQFDPGGATDSFIVQSPRASSLSTEALSTTCSDNTAVVARPSSTGALIEAMKDARGSLTVFAEQETVSTSLYTIAERQQVRFQHRSGTWLAQVVDVWGRVQTLPVICAPGQSPKHALQQLATKAPDQHKYWIHILETDQPPWVPKVAYVGALGMRGGGNSSSSSHESFDSGERGNGRKNEDFLRSSTKIGYYPSTSSLSDSMRDSQRRLETACRAARREMDLSIALHSPEPVERFLASNRLISSLQRESVMFGEQTRDILYVACTQPFPQVLGKFFQVPQTMRLVLVTKTTMNLPRVAVTWTSVRGHTKKKNVKKKK